MNVNTIVGLIQVLVPFIGQLLANKGIIPAGVWTDIGTILAAIVAAGWSAKTTSVTPK